jgi:hypothetical protein
MTGYSEAQQLKFELLAKGAVISPRARGALNELTHEGRISPADYASTSGIIVRLDETEWVNVPVEDHNPNFVSTTPYTLDHGDEGFVMQGAGLAAEAEFWPLPGYHGNTGPNGRPLNNYVFTHGDRVRLSPTIGCAMECTFCNIPYDDIYGGVKPIDAMLHALGVAVEDPVQPARHMLISGGTPGPPHVSALREVYYAVLDKFSPRGVDIMMVPVDGLFDLPKLNALGVNELSINLELWDEKLAATAMRHKHRQGRQGYLDFLETAAGELGGHRVRSMLMVGIEPIDSTMEAVDAIARRGCVPVLSPFRPDPITPMASSAPPTAKDLMVAFERGSEIAHRHGVALGPSCDPCTHNTLNFASGNPNSGQPRMERGAGR